MPELPEVETVCRGLSKAMTGQKIARIELLRKKIRNTIPPSVAKVANAKVLGIARRAKYILIKLDTGQTLIFHLGMSGRMVIQVRGVNTPLEKHDHVVMYLATGARIVFNDARRFGVVDIDDTGALEANKWFRHLGPEPLDETFSADYLASKFKGKKVAVKLALMDQRVVVGVGNIYASEALFMAGISPKRRAGSIKREETAKLVTAIRKVLEKAIAAGGSSLRDYVQADGELGYFQHHWAVYGKQGQKCAGCSCDVSETGGIKRITQGARSTFYCPARQK